MIISTRNRAELLSQCLKAMVRQEGVAPEAYEIIVVDNGSTDDTRQVVETIQQQFPRTRYLYEPRLGLSIARNAGVRHAAGQIVCFTDDDAIPSSNYVSEILASFKDPRVACVGGKVVASWPDGAPPAWFSPKYANVVAQTTFGETPRLMRKGEFPFGCNISFRKDAFQGLGGFDESLGKRGKNNIWGEEIDLCHRLQAEGSHFFYNPAAAILHVVGRSRDETVFRREHLRQRSHRRLPEAHAQGQSGFFRLPPAQGGPPGDDLRTTTFWRTRSCPRQRSSACAVPSRGTRAISISSR